MEVVDYTPLPESATINGKRYTLIKRTDEVYLCGIPGDNTDEILHFEVGIIQILAPDKFSSKWRERPMANGQFGRPYGKCICYRNGHRAEELFCRYVNEIEPQLL